MKAQILLEQTQDAHQWVNKLLLSIPDDKWDETPEVIESNITWQVGHIVSSEHFHVIMATVGLLPEILDKIPMREFAKYFAYDNPPSMTVGKFQREMLLSQLKLIQDKSVEIISSLTDDDLANPVVPSKTPNPVAEIKYEAIAWNIKHTMWHCGQIALIKRVVDKKFDFGLRKQD